MYTCEWLSLELRPLVLIVVATGELRRRRCFGAFAIRFVLFMVNFESILGIIYARRVSYHIDGRRRSTLRGVAATHDRGMRKRPQWRWV